MNMANVFDTETIWAGESVGCNVTWQDMAGASQVPNSVTYQVFDAATKADLTAVKSVSLVAASMTFVIPAADLPIGSLAQSRRLLVVVKGTFDDGSVLPIVGLIIISRLPGQ
jgi:hypothetical protein